MNHVVEQYNHRCIPKLCGAKGRKREREREVGKKAFETKTKGQRKKTNSREIDAIIV